MSPRVAIPGQLQIEFDFHLYQQVEVTKIFTLPADGMAEDGALGPSKTPRPTFANGPRSRVIE